MPKLTSDEQTELLDCPGVLMRIAVVNADGAPSVTPFGFSLVHQDNALCIIFFIGKSWKESQIVRQERMISGELGRPNTDASRRSMWKIPRVALCIDEERLGLSETCWWKE